MKEVILLCGKSGSGKTTVADKIIQEVGGVKISGDIYRKILTGDEGNQTQNNWVFRDLFHFYEYLLIIDTKNIVLDFTNVSVKSRKQWIDIGKKYGYRISSIVVEETLEKCIEKDSLRTRKVGEEVIKNQFAKYTEPTLNEGFEEIVFIQPTSDFKFKIIKSIPEINEQKT